MFPGFYRTIRPIHVFSCDDGHLKLPKGIIFEIKWVWQPGVYGSVQVLRGVLDDISFPASILKGCEDCIKEIGALEWE